jgi:hypothetical protein
VRPAPGQCPYPHVPLTRIHYPDTLTAGEAEAFLATVMRNPQDLKPLLKP